MISNKELNTKIKRLRNRLKGERRLSKKDSQRIIAMIEKNVRQ